MPRRIAGIQPGLNSNSSNQILNPRWRACFHLFERSRAAMSTTALASIIESRPEIQGGVPVFRGTRVPVQSLFDHIEAGDSIDDFLESFRTVRREQVIGIIEVWRAGALAMV
jgi:uncharacterized protein (DUF433 family)